MRRTKLSFQKAPPRGSLSGPIEVPNYAQHAHFRPHKRLKYLGNELNSFWVLFQHWQVLTAQYLMCHPHSRRAEAAVIYAEAGAVVHAIPHSFSQ